MIIKIIVLILIILLLLLTFNKKELFKEFKPVIVSSKKKVALLICGFAPRSFKYVYKNIKRNIIKHLSKNNFSIDVYHHSLISKMNTIDSQRDAEMNRTINNNDVYLLPAKIQTEYQEMLSVPNKKYNCWKYPTFFTNACRGMYSEYKVSLMTNLDNYQSIILITSDSLFLKPISITEVTNTIQNHNIIYTTPYNKFSGLGNGFYICHPKVFKKISSRYLYLRGYCKENQQKNSESYLKDVVSSNNIENRDSSMFYLKIRANGKSNHYINLIDKYQIPNSQVIKNNYG